MYCVFFFFQAEDGIRDLVRSRGLGDVYKRQVPASCRRISAAVHDLAADPVRENQKGREAKGSVTVSYTHLTLPTSDLV